VELDDNSDWVVRKTGLFFLNRRQTADLGKGGGLKGGCRLTTPPSKRGSRKAA